MTDQKRWFGRIPLFRKLQIDKPFTMTSLVNSPIKILGDFKKIKEVINDTEPVVKEKKKRNRMKLEWLERRLLDKKFKLLMI